MKFEHVPIPVGTETAETPATVLLGGIAVAVLLVAVSAPRLCALVALAGGAALGGVLIG